MKRLVTILLVLLLASCSKQDTQHNELCQQYFDTTCEVSGDTIKIVLNDMEYEEIITRTNLLLETFNKDMTIKIYQYNNVIPTIITLKKIDNDIAGYTFNKKE